MADRTSQILSDSNFHKGRMEKMAPGDLRLLYEAEMGIGIPVDRTMLDYLTTGLSLTHRRLVTLVHGRMDRDTAVRIQTLWEEGFTLRAIALRHWLTFGMRWDPPDSQIAGIALVEEADRLLGTTMWQAEQQRDANRQVAMIEQALQTAEKHVECEGSNSCHARALHVLLRPGNKALMVCAEHRN